MKIMFLLMCSVFSVFGTLGAQIDPDATLSELQQQYAEATSDEEKLELLRELSIKSARGNPTLSREYLETFRTLANATGYPNGPALYHADYAQHFSQQGLYEQALPHMEQEIALLDEQEDAERLRELRVNIASLQFMLGNFEGAETEMLALIDDAKIRKDVQMQGFLYNNLGVMSMQMGQHDRAAELYTSAYQTLKDLPETTNEERVRLLNNICGQLSTTNDCGSSIRYCEEGIALAQEHEIDYQNPLQLSYALCLHRRGESPRAIELLLPIVQTGSTELTRSMAAANLGAIYRDLSDAEAARTYFRIALDALPEKADLKQQVGSRLDLAQAELNLKGPRRARELTEQALELMDQNNYQEPDLRYLALQLVLKTKTALGESIGSTELDQLLRSVEERSQAEEKAEIVKLTRQLDVQRAEADARRVEAQLLAEARRKNMWTLVALLSGLLLILAVILVYTYRKASRLERQEKERLQIEKERITLSLEETRKLNTDLSRRIEFLMSKRELIQREVSVPLRQGTRQLQLGTLRRLESEEEGVRFYLTNQKSFWSPMKFRDAQHVLPETLFGSPKRGNLINVTQIERIEPKRIWLKDGTTQIPIARTRKKEFMEWLEPLHTDLR